MKYKEVNILKSEMLMQQKSIYSENYKPLFINEMDETMIKEFSKTLSQKLRHVKLAITKANIGNTKYNNRVDDLDEKSKTKKGFVKKSENEDDTNKKKKLNPVKKYFY